MTDTQRMTLKLNDCEFAKEYPEHFNLLQAHGEELAELLRQGIQNVSFSIDPKTGAVKLEPAKTEDVPAELK